MPTAVVLAHAAIAHELGHIGSWLDDNGFSVTTVHREAGIGHVPDGDLLIVLGSPTSVAAGHSGRAGGVEIDMVSRWTSADRPYLGVCFGAQVLARALGGEVERMPRTFRGYAATKTADSAPDALSGPWIVWHDDAISAPPDSEVLACLDHADLAFRSGRAWGLQPHIEVTPDILTRLAIGLGASDEDWQPLVEALRADEWATRLRAHDLLDAFAADAMGG